VALLPPVIVLLHVSPRSHLVSLYKLIDLAIAMRPIHHGRVYSRENEIRRMEQPNRQAADDRMHRSIKNTT
jgi:hypothetical protein